MDQASLVIMSCKQFRLALSDFRELGLESVGDPGVKRTSRLVSNRIQLRPPFAAKADPLQACECVRSDEAETGVAEPHIAEQSRSWRAASGKLEVMRGS